MTWNLADLFESVVDVVGDRTALSVPNAHDGRRTFTFDEMERRVNRLAHALLERGVGPGDKVALYGYNTNEWIEGQWAAWKIRAVPVNVNYRYVEGELSYLLQNSDSVAVIGSAEFAPRLAHVRADCADLRSVILWEDGTGTDLAECGAEPYEEVLAAASPERDFAPRSGEDLYILYTGGTTGMPKGVMWRHDDFFLATIGPIATSLGEPFADEAEVAARAAAVESPTVTFPLAPLMHGAAQWTATGTPLAGNQLVISAARHMDPTEVWRIVEGEKVVSMGLVGDAQARPLIEAYADLDGAVDVSSLFIVSSGGAILSPAVKEKYAELLPNTIIIDALGASETGFQGSTAGSDEQGRPQFTFGEHTIVLDDDGKPTTPGDGVVGRLARRGHIPLGYYKDEQKTAETFPVIDGVRWVVPGDMAVAEADGRITLLGRGSVSINSGGEKIFPEEVELVLKSHPEVFDAVVVGVPDERWGERVAAVVAPRGDARPTAEELAEHTKSQLASYKAPREVHYVGQLVRSPSGKADYRWAKAVARGEITPD